MNFIRSRAREGGDTPIICHLPDSRPPFSASFFLFYWMPPFFTTFYTQWPQLLLFSVKIFQQNQKCVKIAWILCNFMPNDPLFWICHLMSHMTHTPFLEENCHWWSLDLIVWAPLSLLYVSAPPRGRDCVPKQHGSFKFDHIYYNKGAWPQIIIESIFSDII